MQRRRISAFIPAVLLSVVLATAGCSADPYTTSDGSSSAAVQPAAAAIPSATPTPVMSPVPDASAVAPTALQTTLVADGYTVALVDASGAPVADPTGWSYVSESPAAGTPVVAGTKITVTLAAPPPPPPPPAPVAPSHPAGATAQCNDGTFSYSAHRSGTCSHHGGVAVWF
jgi:hypothetical protein